MNHANNISNFLSVTSGGGCNGFLFDCTGATFNYGDGYILGYEHTHNTNNNLIGIKILGISGATANNNIWSRIEIKGDGVITGCVGIELTDHCNRQTFNHVDIENCAYALEIPSTNCVDNTFISMLLPTVGEVSSDTAQFGKQTFIGGDDNFRAISSYHAVASTPIIFTADATLDKGIHGSRTMLNTGAAGTVTLTLPDAGTLNQANTEISFYTTTAQSIAITAAAGDLILEPGGKAICTLTSSAAQYNYITLKSVSYNRWVAHSERGTWT